MAPEVINKNKYNIKSEVWACGIVLSILLCGKYPFTGSNKS